MSDAKKQHYVSKFLLKNFVDDKGQLHLFRKQDSSCFCSTPADALTRRYFYSRLSKEGERDFELENRYSDLETLWSPLVNDRIIDCVRAERLPNLSLEDRRLLHSFVHEQYRKSPDVHSHLYSLNCVEEAIEKFAQKNLPEKCALELEGIRNNLETKNRIKQNAIVEMLLQDKSNIQDMFFQKNLDFIRVNKENKSFIIGSYPVVKASSSSPKNHLLDEEVEIIFPISYDVAIRFYGCNSQKMNSERLLHLKNDRDLRWINAAIYSQSHTIASRNKRLTLSIANPK